MGAKYNISSKSNIGFLNHTLDNNLLVISFMSIIGSSLLVFSYILPQALG